MENFISGGKMEIHPNAECRTFHMRHELMRPNTYYATDGIVTSEWKDKGLSMTETTIKSLSAVKGVKSVSCSPYEVRIVKAEAFSWEELLPKIKLEMSKYLPSRYS